MSFSKEEKMMWLEDWSRSGKKAWAYAKENGLIPQTFCNWVKKAESKKPEGFVEVPNQLIRSSVESQQMVIETEVFKIHLPVTICAMELQKVLTALGRFK